MTLLSPTDIRELASVLGVSPTKKLGQNFVHDAATVRRIVRDSGVRTRDRVVEVGPGLGSLTLGLLDVGALVSAIEIDPVLARALPATIEAHAPQYADNFAVLNRDALQIVTPNDLAVPRGSIQQTGTLASAHTPASAIEPIFAPTHLVANLPYNVAVPVLLTLLEALPSLTHVTVMVQAEVADRLAASPGSRVYGVPSVKAAWYGKVTRGAKIARTVFWPVPNVDSALVHIELFERSQTTSQTTSHATDQTLHSIGQTVDQTRLTMNRVVAGNLRATPDKTAGEVLWGADRSEVFAVVDAAFSQRRKTLRAALAQWAGSAQAAETILRKAGVDPAQRGEKLGVADFVAIAQARECT